MRQTVFSWDDRRDLIILPTREEAIRFGAMHWLHTAARAIQQRGRFGVALSGGVTPQAIYAQLVQLVQGERCERCDQETEIDWTKVFLFFSDERAVPPDHSDSNYRMAIESGLGRLPIPKGHIFRMEGEMEGEKGEKGEAEINRHAKEYEEKIEYFLGDSLFDLVMLGVGEDGHIASLFPETKALQVTERLVIANWVMQRKSWRMTLSFSAIQKSIHTVIYAFGPSKKEIVTQVLNAPILSAFPASRIGTSERKALWVLDADAAQLLR